MQSVCGQEKALVLCPASPEDLEDLVAIRIEAMRESLERVGRFDPERARERFVSGFDVNCTRRIELSGELVGFVVVKSQPAELLLDHLYVRPHVQGLGVGSAVLQQLFEEADEVGLPIRVGALKESDSNRFYARHGFVFVESAEFDNYYVRPSFASLGNRASGA
ncbi:GNAT family N-acetyltransferase [Pseudomonas sp. DTU_2021_1001937_2_SI_NGA_ILE_001]|uniref:GNAT family N-acetyltransferase n=1 Tax=Pseudomonas sp. DTU_2021_1001937_2_SI_NGA_ILE_001 TaxID=3077589 RepID=UPI0028FC1161|nr:GNAT family N-acetyltransferase [Pseudomonas sp. DTU_2021_1001937_2_SI_NGA_ILE_001]WNW14219.1 GNAT family N-acetyltransferase [Pseudomonas sp. DTU_2021_1001937_2_SI_NGA_ILE_001]